MTNGNTLRITAPDNNDENVYVRSVSLNGEAYSPTYFEHFTLTKGGEIRFDLSDTPNKSRGTDPADAPYSFSK